jgi:hypothetical protein
LQTAGTPLSSPTSALSLGTSSTPEAIRVATQWTADGQELRTFYEASRRRVLWAFLEAQRAVEVARLIKESESESDRQEVMLRRARAAAEDETLHGANFCIWTPHLRNSAKVHSKDK